MEILFMRVFVEVSWSFLRIKIEIMTICCLLINLRLGFFYTISATMADAAGMMIIFFGGACVYGCCTISSLVVGIVFMTMWNPTTGYHTLYFGLGLGGILIAGVAIVIAIIAIIVHEINKCSKPRMCDDCLC